MVERGTLNTEQQNQASLNIDDLSISDILRTINREDKTIALAVEKALPEIEDTVRLTTTALRNGGRVFYIGAGTSGRLGVLDASECPPTYSAPVDWFIGIVAGGDEALRRSIEGAEDKPENAIKDLEPFDINERDVIIGISCSGAAAYVVAALDHSRGKKAKTVYLITNPKPYSATSVDVTISVDTGPEIITGSTRMKAGTATKLVLNMISTASMVRLGKIYGNLMVDLMAVNDKLVDRGTRIIEQLTGLGYEESRQKLFDAGKSVKVAVVMVRNNCDKRSAEKLLSDAGGFLRKVIG
ncbi:uncharacterized protein METZ01_LOCUS13165 [marine metagenome]|uniref:SIS domain-containing protein n=1 Tax=marine metagenome TaxID=408172 RepID=A0A381P0B7_9ZZZZ